MPNVDMDIKVSKYKNPMASSTDQMLPTPRDQAIQAIAEARKWSVQPSKLALDAQAPEKAKNQFLQFLGYTMMGGAEGLTGRPFLTSFENNRLEREKYGIEQQKYAEERELKKKEDIRQEKELALKEKESGLKGMLKTSQFLDAALRSGAITESDYKEGLSEIETLKSQAKKASSATGAATGTAQFLRQFGRSYNELKQKFPEIGETGFSGLLTRKSAEISNMMDELPETSAFQTELLPIANKTARDIEGGKVTDADRKIYADALATSLQKPSATNIRLVSNNLIRLAEDGGDVSKVLKEFEGSGVDIFQTVAKQVYEQLPELQKKSEASNFGLDTSVWERVEK